MARKKGNGGAVQGVAVLRETIGKLEIGDVLAAGRLRVFPLRRSDPGGSDLVRREEAMAPPVLLCDAIAMGTAEVTEISEHGSVPQLAVRNRGAAPILIPEGEVLVGAKQNRVANLTVLVPPLQDFVLPVSCVEAGRWSARSQRFDASGWANPKLRAAKVKSVWENHLAASPAAPRLASDQGRVWREVAECAADLGVASHTGDLHESMRAARSRHATPDAPVVRPELPAGTVGVVAVADGEVLGVDLWGAPEHLERLWPRLWDSYLVDALRARATATDRAGREQVEELLAAAAAAASPAPPWGWGDAFRIDRGDLAGTALVWQGQVQHLAAFTMA